MNGRPKGFGIVEPSSNGLYFINDGKTIDIVDTHIVALKLNNFLVFHCVSVQFSAGVRAPDPSTPNIGTKLLAVAKTKLLAVATT